MCNINILLKTDAYCKDKDDVLEVVGFIQSVTANSYSSNNHGDGIFTSSGKIAKSISKVNALLLSKDIGKSNYIITHQRLSTSGLDEDVHPFIFGDFVMVHNGVIHSYAKGQHSDSYNLFKEFNEFFLAEMSTGATSRQNGVVLALQKQFKEIYTSASFSIAIYDNIDKVMYYFKNTGKYINLFSSDNALFMTTSSANEDYLSMIKEEFTAFDIAPLKVYKFVVKEKISYEVVGDLTLKEFVYNNSDYYKACRRYDDDERFRFGGSHGTLQKRLADSPVKPLVDLLGGEGSELDYTPSRKSAGVSYTDYGPTEGNAEYYEAELQEYKDKYFKKCARHKKCAFCTGLTKWITKKTHVRTCEDCMIEHMANWS